MELPMLWMYLGDEHPRIPAGTHLDHNSRKQEAFVGDAVVDDTFGAGVLVQQYEDGDLLVMFRGAEDASKRTAGHIYAQGADATPTSVVGGGTTSDVASSNSKPTVGADVDGADVLNQANSGTVEGVRHVDHGDDDESIGTGGSGDVDTLNLDASSGRGDHGGKVSGSDIDSNYSRSGNSAGNGEDQRPGRRRR